MDEGMTATIGQALVEVLERQVFLFADPLEPAPSEDWSARSEGFLLVSMGFRGELEGHLAMAVPEGLAAEIGANFLGLEADDPAALAGAPDACKELLNVVCGHILTALRGDEPVFDLSMPRVTALQAKEAAALARRPGALAFAVDGAPLLLMFGTGSSALSPSGEA